MSGPRFEAHEDGGWHFAVMRGRSGGFVAWAKPTPILGPDPVREPGHRVHFDFGETAAEALSKLKAEVFAVPH